MKGTSLKRTVLRKHRGKTAKEAFLEEFRATDDPDERVALAKAAPGGSVDRVDFEVRAEGSVGALYKNDETDDYVIWGPASVEVVDKEDDRIQASALEDALPQLLKRETLSYEHTDQVVGEILDGFETEEPVEVAVNGETFKREEFPTDVLDLEGMEPALYVAGNVYGDTKKSREVREAIDKGEIRSYSISGEAIVTSMSIEDGRPVNDISKLDLSAVTLCKSGMNQLAGFDVVTKHVASEGSADAPLSPDRAETLLTQKTMGDSTNADDDKLTKSGMENLLDKHLPDGEIATVGQVEEIAKEQAEDVVKEELPDDEPEPETESVEPDEGGDDEEPDQDSFTRDELKEKLSDDQWKAISQKLDDGEEPEPTPDDGPDEEEPVVPEAPDDDEEEEAIAAKAESLGLDPDSLSAEQRAAIAKADVGSLETVGGASSVLGKSDDEPSFLGDEDDEGAEDLLKNAEGTTIAGGNFIGSDGEVKL